MTAPKETKQLRVSPEIHAEVMDMARRMRGTADEVLRYLLDPSIVRVSLPRVQRARWMRAADDLGLHVNDFVRLRTEAGMDQPVDAAQKTYLYVRAIAAALRVDPIPQATPPTEQ
jgi:hypothetical protein